jgi:hypothetical protein
MCKKNTSWPPLQEMQTTDRKRGCSMRNDESAAMAIYRQIGNKKFKDFIISPDEEMSESGALKQFHRLCNVLVAKGLIENYETRNDSEGNTKVVRLWKVKK